MAVLLEIVATSLESALAAEHGGADRLEICINLAQGGISPPPELVQSVRHNVRIPIHVMVRPRTGDFCYSDTEITRMKNEIETWKRVGAEGIVGGVLHADKTVDVKLTKELVDLAKPLQMTFHRAFDETPDPFKGLEDIIATGATRILTSGQLSSAFEGRMVIRELVRRAGNRTRILAGAGINRGNVQALIRRTEVGEVHAASAVMDRNGVVDERLVRSLREILDSTTGEA